MNLNDIIRPKLTKENVIDIEEEVLKPSALAQHFFLSLLSFRVATPESQEK